MRSSYKVFMIFLFLLINSINKYMLDVFIDTQYMDALNNNTNNK